jgi:hypothetical protein
VFLESCVSLVPKSHFEKALPYPLDPQRVILC